MKKIVVCLVVILAAAISISAQFDNEGKLKIWTTEKVQRSYWQDFDDDDIAAALCKVRVAKHKGFDRVVFEFDDGKPQYVIQYLPSNIYPPEGGDREIKIAGDVFMVVSIYGMGMVEEMPCLLKSYPKKKLNFPFLMQIQHGVWSEGIRDFIIGVKGEKPFRVKELRNPSRIVIDFKH
ncbi:MAG: hypothetical protein LH614_16545 [Pyrinomonadaceae bacterium]|nr:hypothetical protein [Pyrinomonadaceae bacterium]